MKQSSRKNYLIISIICMIIAGLLISLMGCVSVITSERRLGFDLANRAFSRIPSTPNLHEIISLPEITVHIVGSRNKFEYDKARQLTSGIAGYSTSNFQIWLFGKKVDNQIIINQCILGHEFQHILRFVNPRIADPDKLEEMGF